MAAFNQVELNAPMAEDRGEWLSNGLSVFYLFFVLLVISLFVTEFYDR